MKLLEGNIGSDITVGKIASEDTDFMIVSNGGDLWSGLALYDYLNGKDIEVTAVGMVASAATLVLLATEKRYGTPNSRYLIHNPFTFAGGDAKAFESTANDMQVEQDAIVKIYAEKLSIPENEIRALMESEKVLTAEKALEIGLIKEIRNLQQTYNTMTNTEIQNQFEGIRGMLNSITAMFKGKKESPKNVIIQDANGTEIELPEVEAVEQIAVGDIATVAGTPAVGEYIMPDGSVYVFEGGVLTEIRMPESESEPTDDVENLKKENSELKTQLEQIQSEMAKVQNSLETLRKSFTIEPPEMKTPPTNENEKQPKSGVKFKVAYSKK